MVLDKILIFSLFVGCFYRKGPALSYNVECSQNADVACGSFRSKGSLHVHVPKSVTTRQTDIRTHKQTEDWQSYVYKRLY